MREQYKRFIIGNMDLLRSKDFEQFNTKVYEVREEFNLSRLAITELYEYLYLDKKIDVLSGNATFVPNSFMYYSKEITSIVIPDNIKAIQGSAFAGVNFWKKLHLVLMLVPLVGMHLIIVLV